MNVIEYFAVGAISGAIGYSWYLYSSPSESKFFRALWGTMIAAGLGGVFAVIIDRNVETAMVSGLMGFLVYSAVIKIATTDEFINMVKSVALRLLGGGAK